MLLIDWRSLHLHSHVKCKTVIFCVFLDGNILLGYNCILGFLTVVVEEGDIEGVVNDN